MPWNGQAGLWPGTKKKILKLCLCKWCHHFKMFPLMLWGRSMRNWQLSYFSSTFNWMKLNLLCDADPIQEFLFMSSYRKYLKRLWHLLSGEKFIFSRKTLKEISWYAMYVSPVMLGHTSGFAEVYILLWLIVFTLLYLASETLPATLKEAVNLIRARALSHQLFKSFY